MKILNKLIIISLFLFFSLGLFNTVKASPLNQNLTIQIGTQVEDIAGESYDTSQNSIGDIVAMIIKTLLGLLGIIFINLTLYGGFTWMTAGGDEEKVKKALTTIKNALTGLAIITASYGITIFAFEAFGGGGGGTGGATSQ